MLGHIPDSWSVDIVTASDRRIFRLWLGQSALFRNDDPSGEEQDIEVQVCELVLCIRKTENM